MAEEEAAPVEPGQAAPTPAEPAAPAENGWLGEMPDDMKGYVENKGWKTPGDILNSYQNLEKLRGVPEDKLVRLPDDPQAEGAFDPVYTALGRPESADQYTNALGDEFDTETFKAISEAAHIAGLGDGQFQMMQKTVQEVSNGILEKQEEASVAQFDAWKDANPDGYANAARVMAEVGMTEEGVAGLLSGDKTAIYDFAAKIGARTSEQPVIQGDGNPALSMTPGAATAKIAELMNNKDFMDQYTSPNPKIRQPAIDRMEALHKAKNGEA